MRIIAILTVGLLLLTGCSETEAGRGKTTPGNYDYTEYKAKWWITGHTTTYFIYADSDDDVHKKITHSTLSKNNNFWEFINIFYAVVLGGVIVSIFTQLLHLSNDKRNYLSNGIYEHGANVRMYSRYLGHICALVLTPVLLYLYIHLLLLVNHIEWVMAIGAFIGGVWILLSAINTFIDADERAGLTYIFTNIIHRYIKNKQEVNHIISQQQKQLQ